MENTLRFFRRRGEVLNSEVIVVGSSPNQVVHQIEEKISYIEKTNCKEDTKLNALLQ